MTDLGLASCLKREVDHLGVICEPSFDSCAFV